MTRVAAVGITNKGFVLPTGHHWNPIIENENKEGRVVVYDSNGFISCILQFHDNRLNGVCIFYEDGKCIEKRTYVNDVEEGWACEINDEKEVKWFEYVDGKIKYVLQRYPNMRDYWKAMDVDTKQLAFICRYDSNHKCIGNKYIYQNGHIKSVTYVERGMGLYRMKTFSEKAKVMTEYDNNGNKVYIGNYLDDFTKDYPREGTGFEFDGVDSLVYRGQWKNGKRNGKGQSYKDNTIVYDGEWRDGKPYEYHLNENDETRRNHEFDCNELVDEVIEITIKDTQQFKRLLNSPALKRKVSELIVDEGCGNELKDDLLLSGFENLEKITVKKNSLMNLKLLKISDNPKLKKIHTAGGEEWHGSTWLSSCENVESVVIESIHCY